MVKKTVKPKIYDKISGIVFLVFLILNTLVLIWANLSQDYPLNITIFIIGVIASAIWVLFVYIVRIIAYYLMTREKTKKKGIRKKADKKEKPLKKGQAKKNLYKNVSMVMIIPFLIFGFLLLLNLGKPIGWLWGILFVISAGTFRYFQDKSKEKKK